MELWASWDDAIRRIDLSSLENELASLWSRHHDRIPVLIPNIPKIRSAADMYECWPSTHWFKEPALQISDYMDFEVGDSSYNVWIFTLPEALPTLGRIVCDLYLRATWRPQLARHVADAQDAFVRSTAAAARTANRRKKRRQMREESEDGVKEDEGEGSGKGSDAEGLSACCGDWELQMRPVGQLMRQIWWDPERLNGPRRQNETWQKVVRKRPWLKQGLLLPRCPQPQEGLSLLRGQESVFMTWDRFELWVYGCYVD